MQLYGSLVAWGSKPQATAVESTCAAEFVPACVGENATIRMKDLMYGMTGKAIDAELLVDNQSAGGKLRRPAGGNMWLDLKWRVVHQRHMDKLVQMRYVPTTDTMDTAEWGFTVPILVLNGSIIRAETADTKSSTPLEALRYHEENAVTAGCF